MIEDDPEIPADEPLYGRLPNSWSRNDSSPVNSKPEFDSLPPEEKIRVLAERVSYGYLNGMSGTIGSSDTLSPHIKNQDMVAKARNVGYALNNKPDNPSERTLKVLEEISIYHQKPGEFFAPFFKEQEKLGNENPYRAGNSVREDAKLLDKLINDVYGSNARFNELTGDIPTLSGSFPSLKPISKN